ncbi:MAG TPA: malectin domain-containing carbohydrate-binding protein [Dongiaceae bacterium]|nr:malectin domain-containing carbohydrate-binding protein [Dongiaceae bacterium]
MATEVNIPTNGKEETTFGPADLLDAEDPREELVRRVVTSSTFEKSPKLRAFLVYVCRCAIDNQRAAATEQQIGIHVFGRTPGYNPNEDNIVRSQARLLRLKLEHHFANEGKHEPMVITIPKGRYLPTFETREEPVIVPPALPAVDVEEVHAKPPRTRLLVLSAVLIVTLGVLLGWLLGAPRLTKSRAATSAETGKRVGAVNPADNRGALGAIPIPDGVRIAAGKGGDPYIDTFGRRWESDQFYEGGVSNAGPQELFPPVSDPNLFKTMREGAPAQSMLDQSGFRYHIPVPKGVYELRLYFADPIRHTLASTGQDAENVRHFDVNVNGRRILSAFDAIADGGSAAVDVRTFKDISPAADGKVHLEFIPTPERPFISAVELTPGIPGKLKPIRLSAHNSEFADSDGTRWSGDMYYIGGREGTYTASEGGPNVPELYVNERFGNFSYAIPVPPGSYTVKLHFMESFFSPLVQSGLCRGAGCRVFDVTCNGLALLQDFDIFDAAGGAYRPVIRTFHHLHPNGQGKLLLSFTPKVNYAEVRAIEVLDEGTTE